MRKSKSVNKIQTESAYNSSRNASEIDAFLKIEEKQGKHILSGIHDLAKKARIQGIDLDINEDSK